MEIETVLKVLANLLRDLAARIDAGNSNLTVSCLEYTRARLMQILVYTNLQEMASMF